MINFDMDMMPRIYGRHVSTTWRMAIIYFSYVDLPRLQSHNCLLANVRGHPSCVNIAPKPQPGASHSKTNVLVNSGTTKMGVINMACFKAKNACSTTFVH